MLKDCMTCKAIIAGTLANTLEAAGSGILSRLAIGLALSWCSCMINCPYNKAGRVSKVDQFYLCDGPFQAHVQDECQLILARLRQTMLLRDLPPCLPLDVLGVCDHACMPAALMSNCNATGLRSTEALLGSKALWRFSTATFQVEYHPKGLIRLHRRPHPGSSLHLKLLVECINVESVRLP